LTIHRSEGWYATSRPSPRSGSLVANIGYPLADRVPGNDLWIAAGAVHIDAVWLTAGNVFAGAPGLTVIR
jgi:predicted nucleic acid-binding protein